jgi:hypothetical protein
MKIFIQIASYRDPELKNTVRDLINKAKYKNNLVIGICWQNNKQEDSWDNIVPFFQNNYPEYFHSIKIIDVNYKESKGACWARSFVQDLYDGEDFSLQIDSHSRFEKNWDESLIKMFQELQDDNGVLTTYPGTYSPDHGYTEYDKKIYICNVYNMKNGLISARPKRYPQQYQNAPMRASGLAAGFIFARGHINNIKYDPDFYFTGEEASLALRLFTHGYNLYHPNQKLIYHYYTRKNEKKHWSDHKDWHKYSSKAKNRLECLLGRNNNFDLGIYGLGTKRTIDDWTKYSGIDYINKKLHKHLIEGLEPPFVDDPTLWITEDQINHKK